MLLQSRWVTIHHGSRVAYPLVGSSPWRPRSLRHEATRQPWAHVFEAQADNYSRIFALSCARVGEGAEVETLAGVLRRSAGTFDFDDRVSASSDPVEVCSSSPQEHAGFSPLVYDRLPRKTVEFNTEMDRLLREMAGETGTTQADVLRRAVAVYRFLRNEAKAGRKVAITDDSLKVLKEIVFATETAS